MVKLNTQSALVIIFLALFISTLTFSLATAQETDEDEVRLVGLELEKLLFMLNAWIALFLFVIVFSAYKRDGRKKLLFVSLAFLLFSIKSFLLSLELFILEPPSFLDPLAVFLDFLVLLSFFYGVIRK
jgi:hypothetical protein